MSGASEGDFGFANTYAPHPARNGIEMAGSDDVKQALPGKLRQSSYTREELIEAGELETFGPGNLSLIHISEPTRPY